MKFESSCISLSVLNRIQNSLEAATGMYDDTE